MQINVFGSLRIRVAGRAVTAVNTNRLHSLPAYLILHADTPQPRERLAFLLWPESNESQARTNLQQLLPHLKRALPVEADCQVRGCGGRNGRGWDGAGERIEVSVRGADTTLLGWEYATAVW